MKFSSFHEFKKEQLPRQLYEENLCTSKWIRVISCVLKVLHVALLFRQTGRYIYISWFLSEQDKMSVKVVTQSTLNKLFFDGDASCSRYFVKSRFLFLLTVMPIINSLCCFPPLLDSLNCLSHQYFYWQSNLGIDSITAKPYITQKCSIQ